MSAFHSFLALPDLATRSMSFDATEAYIRLAREERARAMAGLLAGMIGAFRRWNSRRRTEAALRNLDDRILSDIGLSRAEIRQIASGHYVVETPPASAPVALAAPANAGSADSRAA